MDDRRKRLASALSAPLAALGGDARGVVGDPAAMAAGLNVMSWPAKRLAAFLTGREQGGVDAPTNPMPTLDPSYAWNKGMMDTLKERGNIPAAMDYAGKVQSTQDEEKRNIEDAALGFVAPTNLVGKGIRAYHGSPHDFDKFDISKIGTGEGAQAYGHGLYFAENPAVAEAYRDALTKMGQNSPQGIAAFHLRDAGSPEMALARLRRIKAQTEEQFGLGTSRARDIQGSIDLIEKFKANPGAITGKAYEVNIRANPEHFLDWDKPLSAQGAMVQGAFKDIPQAPDIPGQLAYYRKAGQKLQSPETSAALRDAGIPGIKYLDQGSRTTSGGELLGVEKSADGFKAKIVVRNRSGIGFMDPTDAFTWSKPFKTEAEALKWADEKIGGGSRNYVLFRDDIIDILKKYGIPVGGVAGAGALASPDAAQAGAK